MVPKKEERESKRELLTSSDLRKSIQVELRRIRSIVKEIASNYVSKLEASAEDMAKGLEEIQIDAKDDLRKILKSIRELNVKPNKGRRKDLRKIDDLIETLRGEVDVLRDKQEKEMRDKPAETSDAPRRRGRPPKQSAAAGIRRRGRPRKNRAPADSSISSVPESSESSSDLVHAA